MTNSRKIFFVLLGLIGLVIILTIWPADNPSVWKESKNTYQPDCGENCQHIAQVHPGHRGTTLQLLYNPEIDDAVAQWSDCISTVMSCWKEGETFAQCVQTASCPQGCKENFYENIGSNTDPKKQRETFEALFIHEGGMCVPEDRKITASRE